MPLLNSPDGPWEVVVCDVSGTLIPTGLVPRSATKNDLFPHVVRWLTEQSQASAQIIVWSGMDPNPVADLLPFETLRFDKSELVEVVQEVNNRTAVFVDDRPSADAAPMFNWLLPTSIPTLTRDGQ